MSLNWTQTETWLESNGWIMSRMAQKAFGRLFRDEHKITTALLEAAQDAQPADEPIRSATMIAMYLHKHFGIDTTPKAPPPATKSWGDATAELSIDDMQKKFFEMAREQNPSLTLRQFKRDVAEYGKLSEEEKTERALREEQAQRANISKHDLRRILIEYMGAPPKQIEYLVATDGVLEQPGEIEDGTVRVLKPTFALARVQSWHDQGRTIKTLVLRGPHRIGKTMATLYPLWLDAKRNPVTPRPRAFYSAYQVAKIALSGYENDLRAVESMYKVRTLVIDHLGHDETNQDRLTNSLTSFLRDVLEQRANSGLATIITTNLNNGQLMKQVGPAVFTHMESPRGLVVDCGSVPVDEPAARLGDDQETAMVHKRG